MAEPAVPDAGAGNAVVNGARATGTLIEKAAVAAVKSVGNDASTSVAKDATLGARAEAGLNIAADVASVVTGPQDIAAERAVVFAVKEGVEHAPQLAEGELTLGETAVREAPEIAESATVVFDRAASIIKAAGHELIDSQPGRGILETKHAIHSVAEGAEANLGQVGELFNSRPCRRRRLRRSRTCDRAGRATRARRKTRHRSNGQRARAGCEGCRRPHTPLDTGNADGRFSQDFSNDSWWHPGKRA